jgi:hypothetical protein
MRDETIRCVRLDCALLEVCNFLSILLWVAMVGAHTHHPLQGMRSAGGLPSGQVSDQYASNAMIWIKSDRNKLKIRPYDLTMASQNRWSFGGRAEASLEARLFLPGRLYAATCYQTTVSSQRGPSSS